jgi:hypothetical protein
MRTAETLVEAAVAPDGGGKGPVGHDPELSPRDEAVYLLHVAAEVEHALLVQYLYAGMSLRAEGLTAERQQSVNGWRGMIFQIAKEEMAHLLTVQNLLRFLGGPVTLTREDFPFRSSVYPFHFHLEPLTRNSLAKYIFAESSPDARYDEMEEIRVRARLSDPMDPLNHVGQIYEAIRLRLQNPADPQKAITDDDIWTDAESLGYQALFYQWSFRRPTPDDLSIHDAALIINDQPIATPASAVGWVEKIAQQGEAAEQPVMPLPPGEPSHFARFLQIYRQIYREFPEAGDWSPTYSVPRNPNTAAEPCSDEAMEAGRITNPQARLWAQLFNQRYRMLLTALAHTLHLGSDMERHGDQDRPTYRPQLRGLAFREMGNLADLAGILVTLPQYAEVPHGPVAGPPFELPYTLDLPLLELDRWRLQRDLIRDSDRLIAALRALPQPPVGVGAEFLQYLLDGDRLRMQTLIASRIRELGGQDDTPPPPDAPAFARDIRPLFRRTDVEHMKQVDFGGPPLDLSSYDSVKAHRQLIWGALSSEQFFMPPDAPWPKLQLDLFQQWMKADDPLP